MSSGVSPRRRQAGLVLAVGLGVVAILVGLYRTPARAILPPVVAHLDADPTTTVAAAPATPAATVTSVPARSTTSTTAIDPPPVSSPISAGGSHPISTTTSGAAPTTTAPVPATTSTTAGYVAPHVTSKTYPGNLSYPDNVSARYSQATSAGQVSGSATWSGTAQLSITVACPGSAPVQQTGTSGLYVSTESSSGTCTVTIAEPAGTQASVSYSISIFFPSS